VTVAELDEQDLALLHTLQIAPRISWAEAARVLGSTASTLATRWSRLHEEGLAWVTAHPGSLDDMIVAMVEVDCVPGQRGSTARSLALDPRAVSIEEAAIGCDLVLTVMTRDLQEFTTFLLEDLPGQHRVARQRAHLATAIHRQGSSWRLRALDAERRAALERAQGATASGHQRLPTNAWPLIEGLSHNGRATAADLARSSGRNPATVRRQLARLLGSGLLAFRCEVAQLASQWPILCYWHARVPIAEHERTAAALATLPELRLCLSTTGTANLYFSVWARSLPDLLRIERLLGERLPWLELAESSVTLRTLKRMGWLLGPDGRCTGEVVTPTALRQ
jgi:DNA-binding Lrp family transcriptional regulator